MNAITRAIVIAALVAAFPLQAAQAQAVASLEGWSPRIAPSGTTYFDCRAKSCDRGSTVSYNRMPDGPLSTAASFRTKSDKISRIIVQRSGGALKEARITDIFPTKINKANAHTAIRALTEPGGLKSYMASSEISDGRSAFSIVSTAPNEAVARANMKAFLLIPFISLYVTDPKRAPR